MRVRTGALLCMLLALAVAGSLAFGGGAASARLQDDGTPEAVGTPTAVDTTPEADITPDATAATAPPDIVTLVAWYEVDASGDFLAVGPLSTNNALVAVSDPGADRALTGKVDFDDPENSDLPRITLGESVFDAYPVYEDDPESTFRWIHTNDDPSIRPATLVLQINATAGPYEGFGGTATFISRSADPATGVLVIVLNPPAE